MSIFVSSNSKMPQNRKAANQRMLERLGGKAKKKYIGEESCEKSVDKTGIQKLMPMPTAECQFRKDLKNPKLPPLASFQAQWEQEVKANQSYK